MSGLVGKVGEHLACFSAADCADGLFKKMKLFHSVLKFLLQIEYGGMAWFVEC